MRVADYIAETLHRHGVDHVFGVYGAANGAMIDALYEGKPRYIAMHHEQTAGFAAEVYAKLRGLGAVYTTSGPGAQNVLTAVANCYYDSVPVLFFTGNVSTKYAKPPGSLVRQRGFQECDIVAMAKPVTKSALQIQSPKDATMAMASSLRIATAGRCGPVLIDVPQNIQSAEYEEWFERMKRSPHQSDVSRAEEIAKKLHAAKRPGILVGGGCQRDARMIRDSLALLGAPCWPTWNALDIIPNDFPLYAGRVGTYGGDGFNVAFQECDFVLALGTRISGRITAGDTKTFLPHAQIVTVNVGASDNADIEDRLSNAEGIQCDAGTFLLALLEETRKLPAPQWRQWLKHCRELSTTNDPVKASYFQQRDLHPYAALRTLSKHLPHNAIIVGDCGGNIVTAAHALKLRTGQRFITNNGNSPMGFSLAGAIGAHYARPDRPIFCIIGDGGLSINLQELHTVVNRNLPIKIILVNNAEYGITKQYQRTNFGNRFLGCGGGSTDDYSAPEFHRIWGALTATSDFDCFANYELVTANSATDYAFEQMLNYDGPFLCELWCPGFSTYLPRTKGASISEMELP